MTDLSVITDVRTSKAWVDARAPTLAEHVRRVREIERLYADRAGNYGTISRERSAGVQSQIDAAAGSPGRELLNETRGSRTA